MGEMSQKAKRDGWVVAMAPMESYLDPYTEEFSRCLYRSISIRDCQDDITTTITVIT